MFMSTAPVAAQISPQDINQPCTACEPQAIHVADLNEEDAPDALSVSQFDDKLAWYENTGGGYGQQQVISTSLTSNNNSSDQSMTAADVDGDNDLDVIAGSGPDEKAVWFENQIDEGSGFGSGQVITSSDGKVFAVAAATIDGDDQADVVLGAGGSGVIWFKSQVGESGDDFGPANTIASLSQQASDPKTIALADVSGNSNPDVIYRASDVAWHENAGGSFGEGATIATNGFNDYSSVAVGDVDNDNDLDVATSSSTDNAITWVENTGGSFGSEAEIGSGGGFEAVAVADVNGDGNEDVLAATQIIGGDDRVSWFESQGSGFGTEQVITTSLLSPDDVATANVDGGSDVELLVTSRTKSKVAWFENTGSGYGAPQAVSAWPDAVFPQSVEAAALDTDSDVDVLVASKTDDKVSWYENTDGAGSFADQKVISADARFPQEATAADLTNDDKPDAIVASNGALSGSPSGMVAWHENQTGESDADSDGCGAEQIIAEPGDVTHVFAADLDGDDDTDIVATYSQSFSDQSLVWYENRLDEGGRFSTENVIASSLSSIESLHVADLNGGGNDVILGYGSPSDAPKLVWYENTDGSGSFAAETVIEGSGGLGDDIVISLATATVDGDGNPDVVAGLFDSGTEDKIVWYENQVDEGSGFTRTEIASAVERPLGLHTADLNGDGNPDLISASRDDDKVAWYSNTGGSFSAQTVIASLDPGTFQGAQSVFAADVNGDAQTDVLSASTGREEIAWYENTDNALPVELAGFDATVDGDEVALSWQTASETNNAGFVVQRQARKEAAWEQVGFVESKASSGITTEAQSYRFTDADLPYEADKMTYRLKQVDTDGTENFFDETVVERSVTGVQLLGTYPSPARSRATVRYALPEKQNVTVRLHDVLGRQVRTVASEKQEGRHHRTLDVGALPSGVYFLRCRPGARPRPRG
jgi:hypothetical protein